MSNLQRLLTRRPRVDEAEVEDVRERTMARLAAFGGDVPEAAPDTSMTSDTAHVAAPAAEAVSAVVGEAEPVVAASMQAGPTVIVPRTIELGPPRTVVIEVEPHRPPIIVTGDIEPEAVVAEAVVAEAEAEIEAAVSEPEAVIEPEVVVGPEIVGEAGVAKAPTPAVAATPITTASKPARPKTTARSKRPAPPKPTRRPPEAVPVVAQPTPVIQPDQVWPGRWLRDVSPDMSADATSDPDESNAATTAAIAVLIEVAEPAAESIPEPLPEPVAVVAEAPAHAAASALAAPTARPRPSPRATRRTAARPVVERRAPQPTPTMAAFCPYCALALDPAPTASKRCSRCRQRIVVKRVQGRVVLLTEAAVTVFDSERLRSANFGRWSKERAQWLKLAASVHADEGRISRLGAAPLSEKVVSSSKTLYLSTAERQFREAKREDRWEDASQLKRDQATAMYRLVGSPLPPADDVLAMHREAVAIELRGIGKMAKEAGLVGSDCCEMCRADDGRTFRISTESRTSRLPHVGCPRGLCRCRWDLTLRDRTMVQRYLRRTVHAARADRPSSD